MRLDMVEPHSIDIEFESKAWAPGPAGEARAEGGCDARPDWQTVDRALRQIAARRAALDAEEVRWLREAEALEIWRPLGMASALDYLERVCGYAPRTAQDRLRVARALGALPQLTAALASGQLPMSAVRELTRVAIPATEAAWVAAAVGKNLRQIEELVADHRQGDGPDDPPDPQARTHAVRFELAAETYALLRQARSVLDDEHGTNLSDDALVAALCGAVLDGAPTSEPTGRAKYQIAITVCERCQKGWQHGAGAKIAIGPAAVERALCDAQHIGSIDAPAPERAYQDIPPSVARFVWHRDGGRCRVDGCRSARAVELHHIVHRADGGSHEASNIVLTCSSCHRSHHAGLLTISGTADHLEVSRSGPVRAADTQATKVAPSVSAAARHDETPVAPHGETAAGGGPAPAAGAAPGDMTARCVVEPTIGAHMGADSRTASNANVPVRPPSTLDTAILRTQAKAALTGLGWKPAIAHAAVAAAAAEGAEMTLEQLIRESLRRCPMPKA